MSVKNCPLCGEKTLVDKHGEYRMEPPPNIPGGVIVVPDASWLHCESCGEDILSHELDAAIGRERYRRLGLLTPEEVRRVREKTGLSAVDMSHLLGVGEKTYTRWENGRSIQNKSNDTLIRLLDTNAEAIALVDAERDPNREELVSRYIRELRHLKGGCALAMAAHGGDLGTTSTETLRRRLKEILSRHGGKKE